MKRLNRQIVLYSMGGCRTVMIKNMVDNVGFKNVKKIFLGGKILSELIIANK